MYKTEGLLSFYSGLTPALLGLSHVAVQFPAYEFLKTKFTGHGMGMSSADAEGKSQWVGVLFATVLSKIVASSATYPHEVIRTRLQTQQRQLPSNSSSSYTQYSDSHEANIERKAPVPIHNNNNGNSAGPRYRGVINTAKTILKEEGWRAFYAGMGTNMMRAVPAACTTMLTFEYVMSYLGRTKARAEAHAAGHFDF